MNDTFRITYCTACGHRQRAVRIACEIEEILQESTLLIKASGGLFEVEYQNQLIFSKNAKKRFPEDGEIVAIVKGLEEGLNLEIACQRAALNVSATPTFEQWLLKTWSNKKIAGYD